MVGGMCTHQRHAGPNDTRELVLRGMKSDNRPELTAQHFLPLPIERRIDECPASTSDKTRTSMPLGKVSEEIPFITQLILKVASRCNLNCSYCFVYNKGDSTWRKRPAIMPVEIFEAALTRMRRHCAIAGQSHVSISFHGGEPCLIGPASFDSWCLKARHILQGVATVEFCIQTNGTLLNDKWADLFRKHKVRVGVSMDGPRQYNDVFRVDHLGRGSYGQVERGLSALERDGITYGILCVIPLGADPLDVHHHFLSLGCKQITYAFPHFTHDTIAPIRRLYGPTPCADFLIPIFDDWWFNGTMDVHIGDLCNMSRIILGGRSRIETLGNEAPHYVFVESDGEIEGLDNLRVCAEGMAKIHLNVLTSEFQDILQTDTMHRIALFKGMELPTGCRACCERDTCAGGYLPHRFSSTRGFDNPSVWCADLLKLFTHLRRRLGVPIEETYARRGVLGTLTRAEVRPFGLSANQGAGL
jgi:uncharacterized protein